MAVTSCVITDTLPADSTPKSFTRSGFGTPDAAMVIISRANTVNNPQPELAISIGFWDGTTQYAASAHAVDGVDIMRSSRFRYANRIGGLRYFNGTSYVNIAQWTIANVTDGVQFTLTDDNTGAGHYATVILFKGVTSKKVGTFAFPGSASTVDVTDVGFKPDVVFMVDPVSVTAYSTALAESEGAHINFGVGHNSSADVVTQAGVTYASTALASDALVNFSIHNKILRRWHADSLPAEFTTSISAFDANGFSVTPTGASTSRPFYLALELPDPDDAYVGIIDSKASTGTQAYTGVGFTPLALLLASTTETAINQSSTSPTGALMFGATDGTEEQSLSVMDQDAVGASNTASRADTANVLNLRFHDDTVDAVAAYSSFDSDGFTLNYSDGSASARKILAFAIGDSAGGGATIAGALESITLSTFGATVGSARDVAAALESLALTTSAARVSSDRAITASVEAISITTNAATVQAGSDTAISAGLESLTLTGHQASIATDRNVAATLEAITVTGLTATVSTSSNTNISAALESITVTVNPATVSRNTALAAALESLTVTPHAASIAVGQIVAAALESLTLTSYPAGIALDVAVAAQIEQINLATFAAQVGLGTNVAALTEALTLTPHGATLTFAPSVGAARESITVTTFAAVVGASEAALLSPGLEFTIPLSRMGYTIPVSRVHFTIPDEG